MNEQLRSGIEQVLLFDFGRTIKSADTRMLYSAISKAAAALSYKNAEEKPAGKKACYLSAEFLVGRLIYSNLFNLGFLSDTEEILAANGHSLSDFEEIEDDALGNGGLGRLAACFLDSAATHGIALGGYGIRYKYGLFKQKFENGFQKEYADDWQAFGDPWSVRREELSVKVRFGDQTVLAVPYDMPIIGYGGKTVNTLRLWQSEAENSFDFDSFNKNKRSDAVSERIRAEEISATLYPNDETDYGKALRIKQEYFFSSASIQDIVREYTATHGSDFSRFSDLYAVQLNDTHPVVAIPELIRILAEDYDLGFDEAFEIARKTFAYTNHTVMAEALEKWYAGLFVTVLPQIYKYIILIDYKLSTYLRGRGIRGKEAKQYALISENMIHMARLAVFVSHSVNGVAEIHTEILKNDALKEWYALYPDKFNNKTNGITPRRWLALANPALSSYITEKIGDGWITDLEKLKQLEGIISAPSEINRFIEIKNHNKQRLCDYIEKMEGIKLGSNFIFDIQIKRLHEYKRQLMNAFSILYIYFGIKDGTIKNFNPTAFIFGAKAAPGYYRAKGIIKFINEIGNLINSDKDTKELMKVVFVSNYNVTYAEYLTPAADISEQISTAGTEASGTGNMKFMVNGAVTLGTLDGANVEIAEQAGEENNYIFGARVEDIGRIADSYNPVEIYENNPLIKRVVDTLTDGTFSDEGTGMFEELKASLLKGASWHKPDNYYILLDLIPYCEARLRANRDYSDRTAFARKCCANFINSGKFSSDRTIRQYAEEIWGLTSGTDEGN
ncbi:MAG: glycogen/starch/alpha-glucan phosphorylase [Oscillospiraceae bacterium]|jgi:starch phosphorylase|nr:glycogen/starch/alpha-glucan phosphorylase [Oscillospiraceae bacterium]